MCSGWGCSKDSFPEGVLNFVFKYCFRIWVGLLRSNTRSSAQGCVEFRGCVESGLAGTELVEVKGEMKILSFDQFDPANPLYF